MNRQAQRLGGSVTRGAVDEIGRSLGGLGKIDLARMGEQLGAGLGRGVVDAAARQLRDQGLGARLSAWAAAAIAGLGTLVVLVGIAAWLLARQGRKTQRALRAMASGIKLHVGQSGDETVKELLRTESQRAGIESWLKGFLRDNGLLAGLNPQPKQERPARAGERGA